MKRLAYTIQEAAEATGVCVRTIYRRIEEGELTVFKWHGRVLIPAECLESLIRRAIEASRSAS